MYKLAAHFRIWNVEQAGGWIYQITYEQLYTWLEYNKLDPFLEERNDWRVASILNLLHNCNVTKESNLTETKDWLPRSIDERIREEQIEKERENNPVVDSSGWDEMKNRLIASGKPIQTTFKL